MTKVILIASGKGGVGKTTAAINLATSLVYFGHSTVIVDADLNTANVGLYLGSAITPTNLHHVLQGQRNIEDAVYEHTSGIKIIPSAISYDSLRLSNHARLPDVIIELTGKVDYVIIDSPPGLDETFKSVSKACDEVLVVTTPDLASITDSLKTIKFCDELGVNVAGVLINKVRNEQYELSVENIQAMLEKPVAGIVSHDNSVLQSVNLKHPVTYSHPQTSASIGYKKLAAQLLGQKYVESLEKNTKDTLLDYMLKMLGLKK